VYEAIKRENTEAARVRVEDLPDELPKLRNHTRDASNRRRPHGRPDAKAS